MILTRNMPSTTADCSDSRGLLAAPRDDGLQPGAVALRLTIDDALERAGGFGRFQWLLLSIAALVNSTYTFNTTVPVLLLPRLTLSPDEDTAFESLYLAMLVVGMLIFGSASDEIGRTAVLRIVVPIGYLAGLATFACANPWQFNLVRVVAGVSCGGILVSI